MIFSFVLLVGAATCLIVVLFIIAGNSLYDIQETKRQSPLNGRFSPADSSGDPLITVLALANDDKLLTRKCLESVAASTYKNHETIVVDTLTHNRTRSIVNRQKSHQKVTLFKSKKNTLQAIFAAYRRYSKGDLILIIDSESILEPDALSRAAKNIIMQDEPKVPIALDLKPLFAPSIVGLVGQYTYVFSRIFKKSQSAFGILSSNHVFNILYVKQILESVLTDSAPTTSRLYYSDTAAVLSSSQPSWTKFLSNAIGNHRQYSVEPTTSHGFSSLAHHFLHICLFIEGLLLPILLGYLLYLAYILHQPALLLVSLCLWASFLLTGLWGNTLLTTGQKIVYSLLVPVACPVFFFLSLAPTLRVLLQATRATWQKFTRKPASMQRHVSYLKGDLIHLGAKRTSLK